MLLVYQRICVYWLIHCRWNRCRWLSLFLGFIWSAVIGIVRCENIYHCLRSDHFMCDEHWALHYDKSSVVWEMNIGCWGKKFRCLLRSFKALWYISIFRHLFLPNWGCRSSYYSQENDGQLYCFLSPGSISWHIRSRSYSLHITLCITRCILISTNRCVLVVLWLNWNDSLQLAVWSDVAQHLLLENNTPEGIKDGEKNSVCWGYERGWVMIMLSIVPSFVFWSEVSGFMIWYTQLNRRNFLVGRK